MMSKIARGILIFVILIILICALIAGVFFYFFPLKYKDEIISTANKFNISPALIAGIINAESGFDERAVSNVGAVGLMQLMPETAEYIASKSGLEYSPEMLYTPEYNILLGVTYISELLSRFNDLDTALCAYNAGPNKVAEWLKNAEYSTDGIHLTSTPYPATNYYLAKIKQNTEIYKKRF